MRRAAAVFLPILLVACAAPSTSVTPTLAPSATSTPAATASSAPSAAPSATTGPTEAPNPSSTPEATPAATQPGPQPTPPAAFGSATLTTSGDPVPNSDLGGCGSLWLDATIYGQDDCGPHAFKLDAEPVVVAAGGMMTFAAPAGFAFSIDPIASSPDAAGFHSWAVSIAPVSDLTALPEGQQEGLTPEHGGHVLGYGDRAVISAWVKAPTAKGEYLVQLDASVNHGPWTFTWPRFFWRVSIR